ncbi:MAG: hypothetical protein GWP08_20920, partial [Nitrospiraceae bacterium]|nr:hypothetical protein [Nitrospiraceae bacterium]
MMFRLRNGFGLVLMVLYLAYCTAGYGAEDLEGVAYGPRCLYDIDAIKAASLDDLEWNETGRTTLDTGIIEIRGEFSSGQFATIAPADVAAGRINIVKIKLHHPVIFLIPADYPDGPGLGWVGLGAVQVVRALESQREFAVEAVKRYHVPLMLHANRDDDFASLGIQSVTQMAVNSRAVGRLVNSATIKAQRMNYFAALARKNSCAITVAGRLLEELGGNTDKGAVILGGSKQGAGTWLTSAVDDRV